MNATREYWRLRKAGWRAADAWRAAHINAEFFNAECGPHDMPEPGAVRLQIVADDHCSLDDLFGDCYNPKVNPDIPRATLERQRAAEVERVERDGVCGIVGEWFDGDEWQQADSVYGFIGDDWRDSGYDVDIRASALAASKQYRDSQMLVGAV